MRKLKLQMNLGLGDKWDDEMTNLSLDNLKHADEIVLGRNTAEDFIPYWDDVAQHPKDDFYTLGKYISDIPKVVFSGKLKASKWQNASLAGGDITEEINNLKKKKGRDIIVYGGDSFVASLVQQGLVDEFYLLVNPLAFGNGKSAFNPLEHNRLLTLKKCSPFPCGVFLLYYTR